MIISTLWIRRWTAVLLANALIVGQLAMVVQVSKAEEIIGTITGVVMDGSPIDAEEGEPLLPLSGVTVTAENIVSQGSAQVLTNEYGGYELNLSVGEYQLTFSKDMYATQNVVAVHVIEGEITNVETITLNGTPVENIEVNADESETIVAALSGIVSDENQNPIEGSTVNVYDENRNGDFINSDITDITGYYSFDLPPGDYILGFETGGSEIQYVYGFSVSATSSNPNFMFSLSNEVKELARGSVIYNNDIIDSKLVRFTNGNNETFVEATMNGFYQINLVPDTYQVDIMKPGLNIWVSAGEVTTLPYSIHHLNFKVTGPSDPTPIPSAPGPGASLIELTGVVTDAGNNTLMGSNVRVVDLNSGEVWETLTDGNGVYSIPVPPSVYKIIVGHDYLVGEVSSVEVNAGPTVTQNISVTTTVGRISGVITDVNGNILKPHMYVTNEADQLWDASAVHSNGQYTILIPAGTYTLTFYLGEAEYTISNVVVSNNETTPVNFEGLNVTSITGIIRDIDNNPVAGARVSATDGDGNMWGEVTRADGSYTIYPRAGTYTIAANQEYHIGKQRNVVVEKNVTTTVADINLVEFVGKYMVSASDQYGNLDSLWLDVLDVNGDSVNPIINSTPYGDYEILVAAGTYTLQMYAKGQYANTEITVLNGTMKGHHFTLVTTAITGVVRLENNAVVADANVTAYGIDGSTWGVTTDSNGSYTVNVPAGTYELRSGKDYLIGQTSSVIATVGLTTAPDIVLSTPVGIITGKVTSSVDNKVLYPWIGVLDSNNEEVVARAEFDNEGNYTIRVPEGTYTLRTYIAKYFTFSGIEVANGHTTTKNMSVITTTINGLVLNANGDPVGNAIVRAKSSNGSSWGAYTNSNGSYSINVLGGTYVMNSGRGYYSGEAGPVAIAEGGNVNAPDIRLSTPGGIITGTITSAGDQRIIKPWIRVLNSNGDEVNVQASFDNNGAYSIRLPEGTYTFDVYVGKYHTFSGVEVINGQTTTKDMNISVTSITAVVKDADGKPVVNAYVQAISDTGGTWGNYTNSNGVYTFDLEAGTYSINASKGYLAGRVSSVSVAEGQTKTANISLTTQIGFISGTVTTASGTIVRYPSIKVLDSEGNDTVSNAVVTSNEDGTYIIKVPEGTYTLKLYNQGALISTNIEAVVNNTTIVRDFNIVFTGITGRVTDANDNPVSNAYVIVKKEGSTWGTYTGSDGSYLLSIEAGTYLVRAEKGYNMSEVSSVQVVEGLGTVANVKLTTEQGIITGSVLDQNGDALSYINITLLDMEGNNLYLSTSYSDSGRKFSLMIGAGNYIIRYSLGSQTFSESVIVTNGQTTVKNMSVTVTSISGYVRDATGAPVVNANIRAASGTHSHSTSTNNLGAYTINVSAGTYQLNAEYGYYAGSTSVVIANGQRLTQDITLNNEIGIITGSVINQDMSTISYPQVRVFDSVGTDMLANVYYTEQGNKFTLRVPAGVYTLKYTSGGQTHTITDVIVISGQTTTRNMNITRTSISGFVKDEAGNPVGEDVLVTFHDHNDNYVGAAYSDSNGYYTREFSPGTYVAKVNYDCYAGSTTNIVVAEGQSQTADVHLTMLYGKVTGYVILQNGEKVEYPNLKLLDSNGTDTDLYPEYSDMARQYSFRAPTGEYTLRLNLEGNIYTKDVAITMGQTITEDITITATSITGTVRDEAGNRVGANVYVLASNDYHTHGAYTDSNGNYTMYVPAGTYMVKVDYDYYNGEVANVAVAEGQMKTADINLMIAYGKIIVNIVDQDGNSISNPSIYMYDSNGEYVYAYPEYNSTEQTYTIRIAAGSYSMDIYTNNNMYSNNVVVTNGEAGVETITIIATGISGTVTDETGAPVGSDVRVVAEMESYGGTYYTYTDSSGKYKLNAPAGTYTVKVSYDYYEGVATNVVVTEGHNQTVDIDLAITLGKIIVNVIDEAGNPIPYPTINMYDMNGYYVNATPQYNDVGHITTIRIAGGSYSMKIMDNSSVYTRDVVVTNGITTTETITIMDTRISGTVTDETGAPVGANVEVVAQSRNTGNTYNTHTDSLGNYSLKVPAGTYTVMVNYDYYMGETTDVVVTQGSTQTADIELEKALGKLQLKLINRDGTPISYPIVNMQNSNSNYMTFDSEYNDTEQIYTIRIAGGSYSMSIYTIDGTYIRDVVVTNGETSLETILIGTILSGSVTDPTGGPVGANVKVVVENSLYYWWETLYTYTDASGNYSLNVPAGTYTVKVNYDYYMGEATDIVVGQGTIQTANIELEKVFGKIEVKFVNEDGTLINSPYISLKDSNGYDMNFEPEFNYTEQTYTIRIVGGSYSMTIDTYDDVYYRDVIVTNGETTMDTITIAATGIRGTVMDETGAPVRANVDVVVKELNGWNTYWTITDANGNYSLNIPAGTYTVKVKYEYYLGDATNVVVVKGEVQTQNINLVISRGLITGFVINANGGTVENPVVTVVPNGSTPHEQITYKYIFDTDSSYEIWAPEGTYSLKYFIGTNQYTSTEITVTNGMITNQNLTEPKPPIIVLGTLLNALGSRMPYAQLQYEKVTEGSTTPKMTNSADELGEFELALAGAGIYRVVEISYVEKGMKKHIPVNFTFEYTEDDGLSMNGVPVERLEFRLPEANFTGTFNEGVTPIQNTLVEIEHLDEVDANSGYIQRSFGATDADGILQLHLSPGTYRIASVSVNGVWIDVRHLYDEFEIVEGEPFINSYNIAGNSNVKVTILRDGTDVTGTTQYGISLGNSKTTAYKNANSSGQAFFELGNGQYTVYGINVQVNDGVTSSVKWMNINQTFEVTDADTAAAPKIVTIDLKSANVNGKLKDLNDVPVYDVLLQFAPVTAVVGGEPMPRFETQTGTDGSFSIYLPDGDYNIHGYHRYDPTTGYSRFVQIEKLIKVSNGVLVDVHGDPLDPQSLSIKPAKPTLIGTLFQNDGETGWTNVDLIFVPSDKVDSDNSWQYEKRARTDDSGIYEIRLQDGIYQLRAISTNTRWIPLNSVYQVEVVNGQVNTTDGAVIGFDVVNPNDPNRIRFNIVPPQPNVTGKMMTTLFEEGVPLTTSHAEHAWVTIQQDWSTVALGGSPRFYSTEVLPDGSFELNIEEAGEYVLSNVGMVLNGEWSQMQFNLKFTVGTGDEAKVELGEVGTNVRGIATADGNAISHGQVLIRPTSTAATPEHAWQNDIWANTDVNGYFDIYLPLGTEDEPIEYEIVSFWGQNNWVEVHEKFQRDELDTVDLWYVSVESNVTGTLLDADGVGIANAWIQIQTGNWEDQNERWFGTKTDDVGNFKLNITEEDNYAGAYTVRSYQTQDAAGGTGSYVSANHKFYLVDGAMMTAEADGDPISNLNVQGNVQAIVKETLGSVGTLVNAWVTIKPADDGPADWKNAVQGYTGNTGDFTLSLQPGSYKITDIGSSNFWKQLNIPFSISEDGDIVVSEQYEGHLQPDGTFIVAAPEPNLVGVAYNKNGTLVNNGWIAIRTATAVDDAEELQFWFPTSATGDFVGTLDDGDYEVISLSTSDAWIELKIPFNVSGNELEGTTVNEDGALEVRFPLPNVVGTVTDKDDALIKNGWITIKPQGDGEHDWQNARWADIDALGNFALHLPEGDYIIVQAGGTTTVDNSYVWIEPRLKFSVDADGMHDGGEVINSLVVAPIAPNVTGSLYKHDAGVDDQKITNGNLTLVRVDADNNTMVLTREGDEAKVNGQQITVADRTNIWNHTYWTNTDEQGNFGLYLEEGSYYILNAGGADTWYEPGTVIVVNDDLEPIEVRPPGDNFTGSIIGLVQEQLNKSWVQYWLKVKENTTNMQWWIPVQTDADEATNGQGVYNINLPLGSYTIEGVNTPFGFVNLVNTQISDSTHTFMINVGSEVEKNIDMQVGTSKVVKGQVVFSEPANTTVVTLKLIITDTMGTSDDDSDDVISSQLIQTDANGNFAITVEEDHTYDVNQIIAGGFNNMDIPAIDYQFDNGVTWTINFSGQ